MSKFSCRCGYVISDVTCPSTHEARLVTDLEMDDASIETPTDVYRSREVIECPECYRLWVQRDTSGAEYLPFLPEQEPLRLAEQQGGYRG
jgi:hypothetical protein